MKRRKDKALSCGPNGNGFNDLYKAGGTDCQCQSESWGNINSSSGSHFACHKANQKKKKM